MDEAALSELIAGIREHGLLQSITVRRVPGGRYQVIGGHRRLEAYRRLLTTTPGNEGAERYGSIPAHERLNVTERRWLFSLVEDLQCDDLSDLDAALGLLRFREAHQLSTEALARRTGLEVDRVKRLLRLGRAPKVVQDACHEGLMVDVASSGTPKRERVRLDMMAALEFAKLHAHAAKTAPRKADERTARAIQRALTERWTLRRIQSFCRTVLAGGKPEAGDATGPAPAKPLPLFMDGAELRIRREHLGAAMPPRRHRRSPGAALSRALCWDHPGRSRDSGLASGRIDHESAMRNSLRSPGGEGAGHRGRPPRDP